MSRYIHKSHNVSVLLYHIVCPAKYRRVVFTPPVDQKLKESCLEISKRYEMAFIEIGTDEDHVHFLVPSVPTYSVTKLGAGGSINTGAARKLQERQADHRLPALLTPSAFAASMPPCCRSRTNLRSISATMPSTVMRRPRPGCKRRSNCVPPCRSWIRDHEP